LALVGVAFRLKLLTLGWVAIVAIVTGIAAGRVAAGHDVGNMTGVTTSPEQRGESR
jgi:hypothetical protein